MSSRARGLLAVIAAGASTLMGVSTASAAARPAPVAHYDHIFVIVEENHSFTDVIGNTATPNLNSLARTYGIATNYFAVTHPSEPNYVALLGGNPFTVANDNAYYVNQVAAPSLISELDHGHVSWKAYLQSFPHPGY
jgi:phospholipase C